jgi:hypothetical protein
MKLIEHATETTNNTNIFKEEMELLVCDIFWPSIAFCLVFGNLRIVIASKIILNSIKVLKMINQSRWLVFQEVLTSNLLMNHHQSDGFINDYFLFFILFFFRHLECIHLSWQHVRDSKLLARKFWF